MKVGSRELTLLNGFVLCKPIPPGETEGGLLVPEKKPVAHAAELVRARVVDGAQEANVFADYVIFFPPNQCVPIALDGQLYLLVKGGSIVGRIGGESA